MRRLRLLRTLARAIVSLMTWLDENCDRLVEDLRPSCPGVSDGVLVCQVVDAAFGGVLAC